MADFLVGVVMGSESDWQIMRYAADMLWRLSIPFEARVLSAHRTPDAMFRYAEGAQGRLTAIIAGAGGAAHLPGMLASKTRVPVLGVPIPSACLQGMDSLLSIVQMPAGVTVATFGIGIAGATNAALHVGEWLALFDSDIALSFDVYRKLQTEKPVQEFQVRDIGL